MYDVVWLLYVPSRPQLALKRADVEMMAVVNKEEHGSELVGRVALRSPRDRSDVVATRRLSSGPDRHAPPHLSPHSPLTSGALASVRDLSLAATSLRICRGVLLYH